MQPVLLSITYWLMCISYACGQSILPRPGHFALGTDGPAPEATRGYFINHVGMNVKNLTTMMDFYGNVLGMRHIFSFRATKKWSLTYMGYASGGKNGTGFETGQQMYAELTNRQGMIEFLYLEDPAAENFEPASKQLSQINHLGFVTSDIEALQRRLQHYGANIVKPLGALPSRGDAVSSTFGLNGLSEEDLNALLKGIGAIGFEQNLLITDPEGNLIEFNSQE